MITLNVTYLLIALPTWLATLYFLRVMKHVSQKSRELVPVTVDAKG